ncbi:hypothetical protein [Methylobacterium sp. J-068]|uniref:hypothetical protein n=1 Tax=Methylobacterium sp. J-068 TaxID=2836649 RepID=UPI001FB89870|nr:hypothetical protein [Methylobacterium sp. J-068]MCJ2034314.1 hypothetical protein [Methylobacterium sp. J-068]
MPVRTATASAASIFSGPIALSAKAWLLIAVLPCCFAQDGLARDGLAMNGLTKNGLAETTQPPASLCQADEEVVFSCALGSDVVSLCARSDRDSIRQLSYREGNPKMIRTLYVADQANGHRFKANVAPASPGALVKQVWFDQGPLRILLTECIGGDCRRSAGLAVFRGTRVVRNSGCARTDSDLAWFSRKVLKFDPVAKAYGSTSDLLQMEEADNMLETIY